jgi:hypothetical protein
MTAPWLEGFAGDVRYAARHFARAPLSTATMLLVLSLGISVNVVLFTIMSSLPTLPPPGIDRDDALVRIRGTTRLQSGSPESRLLSWPEVQAFAARSELLNTP